MLMSDTGTGTPMSFVARPESAWLFGALKRSSLRSSWRNSELKRELTAPVSARRTGGNSPTRKGSVAQRRPSRKSAMTLGLRNTASAIRCQSPTAKSSLNRSLNQSPSLTTAEPEPEPEGQRIQRVRDRFIDYQSQVNDWLDNCDPTTAPDYVPKPGEQPYFQRGKRRWN
ncbi:hypothetical protein C8R47DRAFT_1072324 [Mycena vitilis]|nr:hypothetical protein C8R47DRAFT_1072324 [Mycena vitilis]